MCANLIGISDLNQRKILWETQLLSLSPISGSNTPAVGKSPMVAVLTGSGVQAAGNI